ncbi:MAG: DUF885 domain-containing protein [Acidimicrobiales bacterium]
MTSPRQLADRFHSEWLATHPFQASSYGIPGYEDLVPDDSEEGAASWRSSTEATLTDALQLDGTELTTGEAVTLGCLVEAAHQELAGLDSASLEHTVTAMPFSGPATLMAIAARTVLSDAEAAADYLTRLRRSGEWIDQLTMRLQIGARKGRLPVAPLVEQAIEWGEVLLSTRVPGALLAPEPPPGWDHEAAWREERDTVAVEVVMPALSRWVGLLRGLMDTARPAEQPGLTYLPGGDADYARAIRTHTTLPLTADQLHQTGLDQIAALEDRMADLGAELGFASLEAVHVALRGSAGQLPPQKAIDAAVEAIRRAEAQADHVFPAPLPAPCAVTPMPTVVGSSGMAPHYTPPKLDGTRPGTFWFNVDRPTAGTGWDLEGVAFHEAVPGHHLQLSRIQLLTDLPAMQRQRSVTVFSEGWGLYAEQLAEEMGLYSDSRSLLGALTASLMRAARLVLDTGLHAFGWSREQALQFYTAHVPLPVEFLASEIDRYIIMPGQALAYLTGKLEILRLREEVQSRLGNQFSLSGFHAAILDSGSLPMPVLQRSIDAWVTTL